MVAAGLVASIAAFEETRSWRSVKKLKSSTTMHDTELTSSSKSAMAATTTTKPPAGFQVFERREEVPAFDVHSVVGTMMD